MNQQSGANFSLLNKVDGSGSDYFLEFLGAHESPNLIAVGTVLYDQSFNIVHDLGKYTGDHPNVFIGMSDDGTTLRRCTMR